MLEPFNFCFMQMSSSRIGEAFHNASNLKRLQQGSESITSFLRLDLLHNTICSQRREKTSSVDVATQRILTHELRDAIAQAVGFF
jgi:hypothetical protein